MAGSACQVKASPPFAASAVASCQEILVEWKISADASVNFKSQARLKESLATFCAVLPSPWIHNRFKFRKC